MTKEEQLQKNGKMRKKLIKDKAYLSWIHSSNKKCIVCEITNIEAHHVYSVLHGIPRSDTLIVTLCSEHHRGSKCSPHGNKGAFAELYSLEELMEIAERNYLEYQQTLR